MFKHLYLKLFSAFILAGIIILPPGCSEEPGFLVPFPGPQDPTGTQIVSFMNHYDIPSTASCIVKNGRIVWQGYYGYKNISNKTKPDENTVYILASISKTFTAIAVMQLYEQGLLDLDEDINTYLDFDVRNPLYPSVPITTRMLLMHRSGLAWPEGEDPEFYSIYNWDTAPPLYPWIKEYIVPGGSEYVEGIWKNHRPGSLFGYSNIGGALLGYIVQAITGKDFAQYCRENIFNPLEMPNSGFRLSNTSLNNLATLYDFDFSTFTPYSVKFYPSTTVWTSVKELSHYLIAMMNGGVYKGKRILKENTIEIMLSFTEPNSPVALIWWDFGNEWRGHSGGFVGTGTCIEFNKDEKVGVIILSNLQQEQVTPGGGIYSIIHYEAEKYIN